MLDQHSKVTQTSNLMISMRER